MCNNFFALLLDASKADLLLDELIQVYDDTQKTPAAELEARVLHAAERRWKSIDENRESVKYQDMLKEKTQTQRMWYEISDLLHKNSLTAVAGLRKCKGAGTPNHQKKCTAIAKKFAKLNPCFPADANTIGKLMVETSSLMPWNAVLLKAMSSIEDLLLMAN